VAIIGAEAGGMLTAIHLLRRARGPLEIVLLDRSPIIGPRTLDQLEEYLGAAAIKLDQTDLDAFNRIVPPGGMVSPFYEAEFGPHPYRV
jgi:2-polyprenyl-6-methoxyphenol hydroxylase-like FAD-dependent oxidoreductase